MGERAARAVELLSRPPATPARFDAVPAGAQAVRRASADHDGKRQAQRCAAAPVAGRTQGGVSHPAIRKPAWGALPSPLSAPSLVTSIQSTFNDAGQPGPPHVVRFRWKPELDGGLRAGRETFKRIDTARRWMRDFDESRETGGWPGVREFVLAWRAR